MKSQVTRVHFVKREHSHFGFVVLPGFIEGLLQVLRRERHRLNRPVASQLFQAGGLLPGPVPTGASVSVTNDVCDPTKKSWEHRL